MNRMLSVGNVGSRAVISPLTLLILTGIPVGQRVSGSTLVRRFNFAHRTECAGASRCYERLFRFGCLAMCIAAAPPYEKTRGWGNACQAQGIWERHGYVGGAPAFFLDHAPERSAIARQLARYRHVGHARLLVGGVRRAPPVDQPPHAGVGLRRTPGGIDCAPGQVLRPHEAPL